MVRFFLSFLLFCSSCFHVCFMCCRDQFAETAAPRCSCPTHPTPPNPIPTNTNDNTRLFHHHLILPPSLLLAYNIHIRTTSPNPSPNALHTLPPFLHPLHHQPLPHPNNKHKRKRNIPTTPKPPRHPAPLHDPRSLRITRRRRRGREYGL